MRKDEKVQIRISSELLQYCKDNMENVSLFIREAMREKIDSGLLTDPSLNFIEIRARTPYIYFAELHSIIDGDTLMFNFDLGFFTNKRDRVRLIGIDALEKNTDAGKKAIEFVQQELTGATILVETRKKEKYGRYLGFVYYSKEHKEYHEVIRYGKLLNEELVKAGLANRVSW